MAPPAALEGTHVRLLPLTFEHVDALLTAASGDRSTFDMTPIPWDRETMEAYVVKALAKQDAGEQRPFATWSVAENRIVGSTRFYDITAWDWSRQFPGSERLQRRDRPDMVSIGYTWLDPVAQRTPVNTEAKLLMLRYAFDVWGVRSVRIRTDARNARSRAAIERVGFTSEGLLRVHMPASDGTARDSAVFSMTADEWPDRQRKLVDRLTKPH